MKVNDSLMQLEITGNSISQGIDTFENDIKRRECLQGKKRRGGTQRRRS